MSATVRVGTCAWVEKGLIEGWYPPHATTAEARLRFYAEHFDTVEVDSSYYAIPSTRTTAGWAERTPDDFVFHVKAFGLMTGHGVRPEQLPADLRPLVDRVTPRGYVQPSDLLTDRVFARFRSALEPLRSAGKLGGVLFQLPPSAQPTADSWRRIDHAREALPEDALYVEFRQRSWLEPRQREVTLEHLRRRHLVYVPVDAPDVTTDNVVETVVASTADVAYVRFHGRNAATWNTRSGGASARFDYEYTDEDLAEWVEPLRDLSRATSRLYAMFNTNHGTQGPDNAERLRRLLAAADVPVAPPRGPDQPELFPL